LYARGRVRLAAGKLDAALDDFRAASAVASDGRITASLAHCICLLHHDYREALATYQLAEQEGFHSAAMFNNMSYCCIETSQISQARDYAERAIQLDPNLQAACFNRAAIEFRSAVAENRHPDLKYIEMAHSLVPEHAEVSELLAKTCALALKHTPKDDAETREILVERAIDEYINAISHGADASLFKSLSIWAPAVEEHPRFRSIGAGPKASKSSQAFARLVDPLYHFTDPLSLSDAGLNEDAGPQFR
jgi:tetratricopeptide (TPR) repeat protein